MNSETQKTEKNSPRGSTTIKMAGIFGSGGNTTIEIEEMRYFTINYEVGSNGLCKCIYGHSGSRGECWRPSD